MAGTNRAITSRFVLTYLAVLMIPVLLSTLFFSSIYQILLGNTSDSATSSLSQMNTALEQRVSEMESIAFELNRNRQTRVFSLEKGGFSDKVPSMLVELQNRLPNYGVSNKFIKEYYLLFPNSEIVANNNIAYGYHEFFDRYLRYENMTYEQWRDAVSAIGTSVWGAQPVRMLKIGGPAGSDTVELNLISFVYTQGYLTSDNTTVLFVVDEETVREITDIPDQDSLLIRDASGGIIFESGRNAALFRDVRPEAGEGNSTVQTVGGERIFVTSLMSPATGWEYLLIKPYNDAMKTLHATVVGMLAVVVASLLIGAVAAVFFSMGKRAPAMKLASHNTLLRQEMDAQKPILMNTFMERLLRNKLDEGNIARNEQYLGIKPMASYQCAIVQLYSARADGMEWFEKVKITFRGVLQRRYGQENLFCHDIDDDKIACVFESALTAPPWPPPLENTRQTLSRWCTSVMG